jgi:hypothetical protein
MFVTKIFVFFTQHFVILEKWQRSFGLYLMEGKQWFSFWHGNS